MSKRKRKLSKAEGLLHAGDSSHEDMTEADYCCPICSQILQEPHSTVCGHSFCGQCIATALQRSNLCPLCKASLKPNKATIPNHFLNQLVRKFVKVREKDPPTSELKNVFESVKTLNSKDLDMLAVFVEDKRRLTQWKEQAEHIQVLEYTLTEIARLKEKELESVTRELGQVQVHARRAQVDRQRMDDTLQTVLGVVPTVPHPPTRRSSRQVPSLSQSSGESSDSQPGTSATGLDPSPQGWGKDLGQVAPLAGTVELPLEGERGFGGSKNSGRPQVSVSSKQVKVSSCMDEVMAFYFETCSRAADREEGFDGLPVFATELSKFLSYSTARELATIIFGDSALSGSCIASCIEFNRDSNLFAVGGVTQKIKFYDYYEVINHSAAFPSPSLVVECPSKGLGLGALRYNMKDVIATQSILLGDMPNQHLTKTKLVYPFRVSVPSGSCASGPQSMICYAQTEEHKRQWMLAIRNAMHAAKPPGSQEGNHDFELETFDRPSHCSTCKKLLWGTYFQGYVCLKCKMPCHRDCLKQADACMTSPTQEARKLPPVQNILQKRPTIMKSSESHIPRQGSIYYAREKYDNPLRGSAYGALMLGKGEEVEILNALDADWWEVISLRTGNRGRVPPSYLKKKEDSTPMNRPRSPDSEGLRNQPWFVGRMSRLSSEQLLHHLSDGVFLIRESDQRHGGFAVALRWKQMPRHIKIQKNPVNQRLFVSDAKDFSSVSELVDYYRQVSLGASFPGVDTTLLYPYWDVAAKEASSSAGSVGLSRRTTIEPSRRPTSTSAITPSRHSPEQMHRISLPMLSDNNSVLRRTSSGAGPLTPPTPSKMTMSNGDPSHNTHGYCEAVYSFKAEYPGELSLQRHCRIRILAKETDRQDWWYGEYNGKMGRFPANYVKELH